MSLADLSAIGGFISGIAVVITLVILVLQLRQASRNQRATMHFQRLSVVQDASLAIMSNPDLSALQIRGGTGDATMPPEMVMQYLVLTRNIFRLFEEFFYQHRDGMLDDVRWATNMRRFRMFAQAPGFRAAWRTESSSYEKDFAAWVETVFMDVAAIPRPAVHIDVWHERVKEELAKAR